jgi:hypothetical protein
MAPEEADKIEGYHYWGAVVFGFVGSFLLWLAIGEHLAVRVVWMPIALAFILAMNFLPEPGATVVKLVCAGAGYPILYLLMGLMALMPGAIAYTFSKTIAETFPWWLQVVTLLVWLLVLVAISLLLYFRAVRRAVRDWIDTEGPEWLQNAAPNEKVGAWLAVLLYVNFVFIAAGCFASIAYLLHTLTPLFAPKTRAVVDHGALADYLLWQLLDALPALKVPETIKWEAPLEYTRSGAGWLVLAFKVMVVIPVVQGIGHYLRDEEEADTEPTKPRRRGIVSPSD